MHGVAVNSFWERHSHKYRMHCSTFQLSHKPWSGI